MSARLRAAGLKATAPRIAVLDLLQRGGHPDAEGVYAAVRERLGSSSLQAVYGVLAALCEAGLAKKIEPAGSTARFEARTGDNHHHLICSDCGRIEDVDCAVGEAPCMSPVTDHGFSVHTAEVTYWGICPDCQAARTTG
ncbi:Fur family transcriptional regulator [Leucobacter sp. M11]|nr:Fur family transcriptional regulator [Leucobacter sp. M11]